MSRRPSPAGTLTLPWPDGRLNPNRRIDRRRLTDVRSIARNAGYLAAKAAGWAVPDRTPLHLFLEFCPPDKRRRDDDNLVSSFKWMRDGIFAALGVDDSNVRLTTFGFGRRVDGGAVIVRLEIIGNGKAALPRE